MSRVVRDVRALGLILTHAGVLGTDPLDWLHVEHGAVAATNKAWQARVLIYQHILKFLRHGALHDAPCVAPGNTCRSEFCRSAKQLWCHVMFCEDDTCSSSRCTSQSQDILYY